MGAPPASGQAAAETASGPSSIAQRQHVLEQKHAPQGSLVALTIGALGVVYGDIGTSPLYAITEIFYGHGHVLPTRANVLGAISLVLWTLTLLVATKYLFFVLRADNDGEGGVFALYALLHRSKRFGLSLLLAILVLGAGLLFGDGVITPAISVLSAIEGLTVVTPALGHWTVPITVTILTGLFLVQQQGTARVGRVFGPIAILWFIAIALLGLRAVAAHPEIVAALDPRHGARFLRTIGIRGAAIVLGSVFLTVTGGEALYADMGHFGKVPIRIGWSVLVFPALVLNYLGQGAHLLSGAPTPAGNVFYSLVPRALLLPMVALATLSTIIAAQALISGAFSLAAQASALGLFPRLAVVHTHHAHEGQIYVPVVNWGLYIGCVLLVVRFGSSTALASAYGLAESAIMLATTMAMSAVARIRWRWHPIAIALVFGSIAVVDASFLGACSLKLFDGGYVPLTIGLVLFVVMRTWRWGRKATFGAYSSKHTMTVRQLVETKRAATSLIDRNVVLMVPRPVRTLEDNTPALLQFYWDRHGMLPRNLIFVEIVHVKSPWVHHERYHVRTLDKDAARGGIQSVSVHFGFMEDPNVERVLEEIAAHHEIDLPMNPHEWAVYASIERLHPAKHVSYFGRMRLRLFSLLRQISQPAHFYYGLAEEVNLSLEVMGVKIG
jgi:KUP system potassium uptake protein